ncbi:MAG: hypothetical protein AABW46_02460 [Nanoarchaeota archaeon]
MSIEEGIREVVGYSSSLAAKADLDAPFDIEDHNLVTIMIHLGWKFDIAIDEKDVPGLSRTIRGLVGYVNENLRCLRYVRS